MLYSMTGYGEHSEEQAGIRAGFRVKSVNNKGLDLNLKLPFDLMYLEPKLRPLIGDKLYRGRVDVFAEIEIHDPEVHPEAPLNQGRLAQLRQMARTLTETYGVTGTLDINTLVRLPDLTLAMRVGFRLPDRMEETIIAALTGAVDALLESRGKEGDKLKGDILKRMQRIAGVVDTLQTTVSGRGEELKDLIAGRVKLLLEEYPLDDLRLYQEYVYYADRLDVSEEITRLKAHIGTTRDLLESTQRPLGKQLDFMVQEQMREVSTVGNKAKHKAIADIVVKLKTEYEKIREQVQNLE